MSVSVNRALVDPVSSTSSNEQFLAVTQAVVTSPIATDSLISTDPSSYGVTEDVVQRLTRYRDFYRDSIEQQQERIADIHKALDRFSRLDTNDSTSRCAMVRLQGQLDDAQRCLCEAQLAMGRQEMEIARWQQSTNNPQPNVDGRTMGS